MKKFVLFAAFAAMVLSSCTKEDGAGLESNVRTVQFTTSSVETKTVFGTPDGSTYPVLWSDNDAKVGVAMNLAKILPAEVTVSEDYKTAQFYQEFTAGETHQFVVVNPYEAFKSVNANDKRIMLEIPSGQACTATTPDERSQVMVGLSDVSTELPEKVSMNLKHIGEYLHMSFKNVALGDATVQSVSIASDLNIAGRFYYTADGTYVEGNSMLKSITITPETLDDVWCTITPVDLSGTSLTVSIITDQGSFSKTLTIPSGHEFKPGKIFKFTVDMDGVTMKEPVVYELVTSADELHWGDRVIVVAAEYDFALSTAQNTNNRSGTGITKGDGVINDPSDGVEVLRLEDGAVPGTWSFIATNGENDGYLYAAAGYDNKGNYLRTKDTLDELGSWNISFGDFTDNDKAAPDAERAIVKAIVPNRPLMRYNVESNLFSSYGETTGMYPIKLYRLKGDADTTPRFNSTMLSDGKTIANAANELPVYVFGNVAWTASVSGATLDKTSGSGNDILTVSIPENTTTSSKTITVTVSTSASVSPKSYTFTVTQNGKSSESLTVGTVLFNESWAAGTAGQTPSEYQNSGDPTSTVVFGGADVVYSENGASTKLYADGLVYVPSSYSGDLAMPENMFNLMLAKNGGWWKIEGIPCSGVKKASLVLRANYKSIPTTVTSNTDGVTVGDLDQTNYTSDWGKNVYLKTYEITFDDSMSAGSFDITFANSASSNVRMSDIELIVTELK